MSNYKRVVITGLGIKSSIGISKQEVTESLREAKSGIEYCAEYEELGFRSHVYGPVKLNLDELIDRKLKRFMGDAAAYCYLSMQDAITDARLEQQDISNARTGLIVGTGGSSTENMLLATDTLRQKGAKKVPPTLVPRTMSSTASACLGVAFKIKGVSYSISSACTTSLHCIGNACELIQMGKQDIVFAGGGDEVHWTQSILFDAMGALSSRYNQTPQLASRPFDTDRDGFVISGGGGIVVVEELEHARARNAHIYAEITGYGATCDGDDMVKPNGDGAIRSMQMALANVDSPVDYINAHATSTPAGDGSELLAIREVFKDRIPHVNATKALTGHGLGAAGVTEAIYTLLMMQEGFICKSANITTLEDSAKGIPIVLERIDNADITTALSNSFGFGGTNGSLVFQKLK